MRRVRNVRHLASGEIVIARGVFNYTIPYDRVLISDALGKDDREFTMPTDLPTTPLFNVSSKEGKYVIHAGDGYYGMSTVQNDKETLVHELTHVWQGEHDTSAYWAFAAMAQLQGDDPYAYDHDHLDWDWDNYSMEQQAKIVEDWFADGSKPYDPDTEQGDERFYFIKAKIRGEHVDYNWLLRPVKPLPHATLAHVWPSEASAKLDAKLLSLLKQRFTSGDFAGYEARLRKVEEIFNQLDGVEAMVLRQRLEARNSNDELARNFYESLSRETTNRLMGIVRLKWPYATSTAHR